MWSVDDIGDLTGRVALVTGASGGIGRETAQVLRGRGATVLAPGRDELDLGDLASVRAFAAGFPHERLDLLVNNAGLMIPPYGLTADGFETQIGVNHLGPFALTGLLLDRLLAAPGARVVTVSSNGHKRGVIDLDDLHFTRRKYVPMTAYAQSKLANLLFAAALHRRLAGTAVLSVAAHPGAARTGLMRTSPLLFRFVVSRRTRWAFSWLIQDPFPAALPILRAATEPEPAFYYGPGGWGEFTGRPVEAPTAPAVSDVGLQDRLWAESEHLTGVTYGLLTRAPGSR
ncbi:SDR family NAD(P)-dependent oxidoreductase [Dactylosporangium sp. NPDC051541]|uniref:SDR family NAD(P)-dependent oxidoreductase n=1 Tax=Dactylosporangium sp. NPDC051541 TaxID=3363977 RepID=UPI0037A81CFF